MNQAIALIISFATTLSAMTVPVKVSALEMPYSPTAAESFFVEQNEKQQQVKPDQQNGRQKLAQESIASQPGKSVDSRVEPVHSEQNNAASAASQPRLIIHEEEQQPRAALSRRTPANLAVPALARYPQAFDYAPEQLSPETTLRLYQLATVLGIIGFALISGFPSALYQSASALLRRIYLYGKSPSYM